MKLLSNATLIAKKLCFIIIYALVSTWCLLVLVQVGRQLRAQFTDKMTVIGHIV
jgi:hypothetical protein